MCQHRWSVNQQAGSLFPVIQPQILHNLREQITLWSCLKMRIYFQMVSCMKLTFLTLLLRDSSCVWSTPLNRTKCETFRAIDLANFCWGKMFYKKEARSRRSVKWTSIPRLLPGHKRWRSCSRKTKADWYKNIMAPSDKWRKCYLMVRVHQEEVRHLFTVEELLWEII